MAVNNKLNNELRSRLLKLKDQLEETFSDFHVKKDVNLHLDDISHQQSRVVEDYRNYIWLELHKSQEITQIKQEAKEQRLPSSITGRIDDIAKNNPSSFAEIAKQREQVEKIKTQIASRQDQTHKEKVSAHSMFKKPVSKEKVAPSNKPKPGK